MFTISTIKSWSVGLVLLMLFGCEKEVSTKLIAEPYDDLNIVYDARVEPKYEQRFQLGRRLFYDKILSKDESISCESCHKQKYAFSDMGKVLSAGVGGRLGKRNSPALMNMAWSKSFMADGGINHLETMPLAPITDSLEMNISMLELLERLNNNDMYKGLFIKVYGEDTITDYHLFKSLAAFTGSLYSLNSKYDKHMSGEDVLSKEEQSGYSLFVTHCISCHSGRLFTNGKYLVNKSSPSNGDVGRAKVSGDTVDKYAFKVPSLRNIALTSPYFHDGSQNDLNDVLVHYQQYFKDNGRSSFSDTELVQLLSFLKTLTDVSFVSNPKFSKPNE